MSIAYIIMSTHSTNFLRKILLNIYILDIGIGFTKKIKSIWSNLYVFSFFHLSEAYYHQTIYHKSSWCLEGQNQLYSFTRAASFRCGWRSLRWTLWSNAKVFQVRLQSMSNHSIYLQTVNVVYTLDQIVFGPLIRLFMVSSLIN